MKQTRGLWQKVFQKMNGSGICHFFAYDLAMEAKNLLIIAPQA